MSALILYLLKLSVGLTLVFVLYYCCLRRLTFYTWNRWYLLGYSALCFPLATVNVGIYFPNASREFQLVGRIPTVTSMEIPDDLRYLDGVALSWEQIIWWLVCTGITFFAARLTCRYIAFQHLRRSAKLLSNGAVKVFHLDKNISPFSFGNSVYINQTRHSESELTDIMRHEFAHVKGRHTIDILWAEILCTVNWFNPFAWLLRHHIRQNLEYVADQKVVSAGIDKKEYQYLLLKVIGGSEFRIATNFNFSSLKNRIIMMNATKTAGVHALKFLFILPVTLLLLLAFRSGVKQTKFSENLGTNGVAKDTVPNKTAVPKMNTPIVTTAPSTPALIKNTKVRSITWEEDHLVVTLSNGRRRSFNPGVAADRTRFEKMYGPFPPMVIPPGAGSVERAELKASKANDIVLANQLVFLEQKLRLEEHELKLEEMKFFLEGMKQQQIELQNLKPKISMEIEKLQLKQQLQFDKGAKDGMSRQLLQLQKEIGSKIHNGASTMNKALVEQKQQEVFESQMHHNFTTGIKALKRIDNAHLDADRKLSQLQMELNELQKASMMVQKEISELRTARTKK